MTVRFVGCPPSFFNVLSLSHPAMRTHVGLFGRMFHAPQVDMRLPTFLSPELRRLACMASSDEFAADYCKASAFSMGDIMRGSVPDQVRRGRGEQAQTPIHESDPRLTDVQRAVVRFARAAVRRPYPAGEDEGYATLAEGAWEVRNHVGARGLEVLIAAVSFVGSTNALFDVLGTTLGAKTQSFALQHLPAVDGQFSVREKHRNLYECEASEPWPGEDPGLMGMRGKVENLRGLASTMPAACAGMKYEMFHLYEGIPMRTAKLYHWLGDRLGKENIAWFRNIQGHELKRAFCFALRENMPCVVHDDRPRLWSAASRICFLYLFARVTESVQLAEMAVELMPAGREPGGDDLAPRRQLTCFMRCKDEELLPVVAVARRLVYASAVKMGNISPELVEECVQTCSPEALIELASLLSFFEMWRRMVLLFGLHLKKKSPVTPLDTEAESPLETALRV